MPTIRLQFVGILPSTFSSLADFFHFLESFLCCRSLDGKQTGKIHTEK
jgi:hypothetical protein